MDFDLSVQTGGVADQAVGERTVATGDRTDQRAGGGFAGVRRVAAGDRTRGQIQAALAQVEGFFVDRYIPIHTGDEVAVGNADGDGRGAFVAIAVADGVGERVSGTRRAYRVRVAVIDGVARRIQGQVAVVADDVAVEAADG
ncbi:hypothetical protein D3C81_1577210 [compost metagenome]